MAFTHLHVHSEYSLLDGMSKINKAPEYVKSLGMDSLAITDHGVMFGIIDFYKSCKKSGTSGDKILWYAAISNARPVSYFVRRRFQSAVAG